MKQNVVDVLMYLFENIITDENFIFPENEHMFDSLEDMGFPPHEILLAFDWLEDLAEIHADQQLATNYTLPANSQAIRIFSQLEKILLNSDCLSFLMQLEQNKIISALSREVI